MPIFYHRQEFLALTDEIDTWSLKTPGISTSKIYIKLTLDTVSSL